MYKLHDKPISHILLATCLLLWPFSICALEDYLFSVDQPKLIIYPHTSLPSQESKPSRLLILSRDIAKASHYEKQEFIEIVLYEMINIYEQEAERAIERAQILEDKKKANKLYRWSQHASDYAVELGTLYDSLSNSSRLDVYTDNDQSYLLIDNYPVEISSPVLNQQQHLEERVVSAVCSQMICDMQRLDRYAISNKRSIRIRAGWRIQKEHYVFYTTSGIQFVFDTIDNKKIKQKMALKIAADMSLLAQELAKLNEKGVFIDWQHMHIDNSSTAKSYAVVINPLGDRIVLPLMLLHLISDFPKKLIPWFKARLQRPSYQYNFQDADALLKKLYH